MRETLASHGSHQANAPTVPFRHCAKRYPFARSSVAVDGMIVGCLYLPNGNPAPGPKFDYKLRWFDRLAQHAGSLLGSGEPVVLAGDYNVMPTDLDVYAPERWVDDALFRPEVREAYRRLVEQGWRALHPGEQIYTFWKYFRNAFARDAGLRIDHLLLSPPLAKRLTSAGVDRQVRGREHASDHAPAWIELAEVTKVSSGVDGGVNPRKSGDDRKSGTRFAAHDQPLLAISRSDANGCSVALCQRRQPPKAGAVGQRLQRVAGPPSLTIESDGWFSVAAGPTDRRAALCKDNLDVGTDCAPFMRGFSPPPTSGRTRRAGKGSLR